MSNHKDQDMLNQYPDLSDDDDQPYQTRRAQIKEEKPLPNSQPQKFNKPNQSIPPTGQNSKPIFTAPLLFGGKVFIPPPPPPSSKPKYTNNPTPQPPPQFFYPPQNKIYPNNPQNNFKPSQQPPRQQRERKNCVYVKNIPKHYNQNDKLMTFFKNEGQIREIKSNQQDSTAVVRFAKEEDALKFVNSKKAIFNRSFITYSLNDKDPVQSALIKQRENEEAGKFKKPIQLQIKDSKQKLQNRYADKIRALLFLIKNIFDESLIPNLKAQLQNTIEDKKKIEKLNIEQLEYLNKNMINQYDWTFTYNIFKRESEKKGMFFQLQKKFGPVSILEVTPVIDKNDVKIDDIIPSVSNQQKKEYKVRLIFLGLKNAWEFYYFKVINSKIETEQQDLKIEGFKLRTLFDNGAIKKPMNPVIFQAQPAKEDPKDEEIIELLENGQVRPIPAEVSEPKLDQPSESNPKSIVQNIQEPLI